MDSGIWSETAAFRIFADADPIPEPATMLLLGTGLAIAGWRRHRLGRTGP